MFSTQSIPQYQNHITGSPKNHFSIAFQIYFPLKTFTLYSFIHSIFIECLLAQATVVDSRLTEVKLPFLPKRDRFLQFSLYIQLLNISQFSGFHTVVSEPAAPGNLLKMQIRPTLHSFVFFLSSPGILMYIQVLKLWFQFHGLLLII